jgi:hypothetical protein
LNASLQDHYVADITTLGVSRHLDIYFNRIVFPTLGNFRSPEDDDIWKANRIGRFEPLQIFPMTMMSMVYIQSVTGRHPGADFFKIKAHNLQIINSSLNDICKSTSDGMLWGLCISMIVETAMGNQDEVFMHAKAITQIAKLRGGWECLPLGLKISISQIGLKISYGCTSSPELPVPVLEVTDEPSPQLLSQLFSGPPESSIYRQGIRLVSLGLRGFCRDLDTILIDLRHISQYHLLLSIHQKSITIEDASYFRNLTLATEYKLIQHLELSKSMERSFLLACLMAINLLCNPWPRTLWILPSLTKQLSAALDLNPPQHNCEDVVLWILFMGSHCAEGQSLRPWFIVQLGLQLSSLNLTVWHEVREILQEFLYDEQALSMPLRKIFQEAQILHAPESTSAASLE